MQRTPAAPGITLLELLIALAIFAVLAAFAYPQYAQSVVRARRAEGQAALIAAMQKEEVFRSRRNTYVAFSAQQAPPPETGLAWWSGQDAPHSAYEIDASACDGERIADCVELRARPGTAQVNPHFRDPDCGVLTLNSRGRQTASGSAPRCWP